MAYARGCVPAYCSRSRLETRSRVSCVTRSEAWRFMPSRWRARVIDRGDQPMAAVLQQVGRAEFVGDEDETLFRCGRGHTGDTAGRNDTKPPHI